MGAFGGTIDALKGLRRARKSPDAASGADDAVEQGAHIDFSDEAFRKRLTADVAGRLSEQPARAIDAGTSNLALTAKYGGGTVLGGTALYTGSQAYQANQSRQMAESNEATFEEYLGAREEIMNNENLDPSEREQRLRELREAYQQAIENAKGDGGGPGGSSGGGGWLAERFRALFGGMSLPEKVLISIVIVVIVREASQQGGM